eukprot:11093517-Alexandrium_andersonii.AAC.1
MSASSALASPCRYHQRAQRAERHRTPRTMPCGAEVGVVLGRTQDYSRVATGIVEGIDGKGKRVSEQSVAIGAPNSD